MRFKSEKEDMSLRQSEWELWFAWYPVKIDNEYVWWEYVERKECKILSTDNFIEPIYYYRNAKNLINSKELKNKK